MRSIILIVGMLLTLIGHGRAESSKGLMQKALFAEEVEEDKGKAAKLYERMIEQSESIPKQLAVARFRLAKLKLSFGEEEEAYTLLRNVATDAASPAKLILAAKGLLPAPMTQPSQGPLSRRASTFDLIKDKTWNWYSGQTSYGSIRFLPGGRLETTHGVNWLVRWTSYGERSFRITQNQGKYWVFQLSDDGTKARSIEAPGAVDAFKSLVLDPSTGGSIDRAEINNLKNLLESQPDSIGRDDRVRNLVKYNRVKTLAYLLEHGVPVDQREHGSYRWTFLMFAIEYDNLNLARFLIEKGANVNCLDNRNTSPVFIAARYGNPEMIRLLLKHGGELHHASSNTYEDTPKVDLGTALHAAARYGHLEAATLLLDHGSDINVISPKGYTPLDQALISGRIEMVVELLNRGANLNRVTHSKFSPIRQAASDRNLELVKLMLSKGARTDIQSNELVSHFGVSRTMGAVLPTAARAGHLEIAKVIVEAGCPVDQTTPIYAETALHAAALHGNTSMCRWLLEQGANPNHRLADNIGLQSGWLPLHSSAWRGSTEVAELLMAKGASPAEVCGDDGFRRTAFHLAVMKGWLPMVELLLNRPGLQNEDSKRQLLSQADKEGNTPLHLAVSNEATTNLEMVKWLIAAGAPKDAINKKNQTPRQLCSDPEQGCNDIGVRNALR